MPPKTAVWRKLSEQALRFPESFVSQDHRYCPAYGVRGLAYILMGRYTEAIPIFKAYFASTRMLCGPMFGRQLPMLNWAAGKKSERRRWKSCGLALVSL